MAVLLFSIIQRCVAPRLSPDYSFRKEKKIREIRKEKYDSHIERIH